MVQKNDTRQRVSEAFRARVAEEMKLRGLGTPEDLAHFAGVTKNTGYNWFAGGLPRADGLAKLVRASKLSADYWLGLSDVRQPPAEAAQAVDDDPPKPLSPEALEALGEAVDRARRRGPRARKQDQPREENPGQAEA